MGPQHPERLHGKPHHTTHSSRRSTFDTWFIYSTRKTLKMSAAMPRVSSTDFFKATKNGVDDVRIAVSLWAELKPLSWQQTVPVLQSLACAVRRRRCGTP